MAPDELSWAQLVSVLDSREKQWRGELERVSSHIIARLEDIDRHGSRGLQMTQERLTDHLAYHKRTEEGIREERGLALSAQTRKFNMRIALVSIAVAIASSTPGYIALVLSH